MVETAARTPAQTAIEAYGNGGFRFAGLSHRGSLLCLPSGMYVWPPQLSGDLQISDFDAAFKEQEALGVLLLGCGGTLEMPPPAIRQGFAERGLWLEVMDTGAAARTYNVLLAEGRQVAAALLAVE
jgi:uncharacterized protein